MVPSFFACTGVRTQIGAYCVQHVLGPLRARVQERFYLRAVDGRPIVLLRAGLPRFLPLPPQLPGAGAAVLLRAGGLFFDMQFEHGDPVL